MKDEPLTKYPVPANDGSRFAAVPLTSEINVPSLVGTVATPTIRPLVTRFALPYPEESLVVDDRSNLTPAQMVETKLISRLKESSLPVSHLQMRGLVRNRPDA